MLLFDHQRRIAQQFGYRDQDHNLAVEQFMQRYYRTVNALSRLNEMLLQLFEEAILLADEPGEPQPINRRFQARRGYLEVTRPNVFLRYPFALLEIFPGFATAPGNQGHPRLHHPADPRPSAAD
jgi:[protein-PII] uridylyltransferase